MLLTIDRLSSRIGTLLLVSDDEGRVRALDFHDYEARMLRLLKTHYGDTTVGLGQPSAPARRALDAYFVGDLTAIDDVPIATGGTPFQRAVWTTLRRLSAGTTTSYGALAAGIGHPSAMRAVGLAGRLQSGRHHRAVPPGDRRRSFAHRLCGRPRAQALAARA